MRKAICFGGVVPSWSLDQRMKLCAHAGYDGIEINQPGSDDEARELKAAADKHGLVIHGIICDGLWRLPLSSRDEDTRRQGLELAERALHMCRMVGADGVLVVPAVVDTDTHYRSAWELSMGSCKHLHVVAKRLGVQVWIENVWNRFLYSPVEFAQFVDEVAEGSGHVGAYFDVGNVMAFGYPQDWIRILNERIKRIHVKDFIVDKHSFVYLFEGDVPWAEIRSVLSEVGYDSYITAELPPYRVAPDQMVEDTAQHIDRIIRREV